VERHLPDYSTQGIQNGLSVPWNGILSEAGEFRDHLKKMAEKAHSLNLRLMRSFKLKKRSISDLRKDGSPIMEWSGSYFFLSTLV